MTNENKPVDLDRDDATEVTAGKPVGAPALSQMGATFAERAAAAAAKQVDKDADQVEDKAVTSASTKKRASAKPARKR